MYWLIELRSCQLSHSCLSKSFQLCLPPGFGFILRLAATWLRSSGSHHPVWKLPGQRSQKKAKQKIKELSLLPGVLSSEKLLANLPLHPIGPTCLLFLDHSLWQENSILRLAYQPLGEFLNYWGRRHCTPYGPAILQQSVDMESCVGHSRLSEWLQVRDVKHPKMCGAVAKQSKEWASPKCPLCLLLRYNCCRQRPTLESHWFPEEFWYNEKFLWSLSLIPGTDLLKPLEILEW